MYSLYTYCKENKEALLIQILNYFDYMPQILNHFDHMPLKWIARLGVLDR